MCTSPANHIIRVFPGKIRRETKTSSTPPFIVLLLLLSSSSLLSPLSQVVSACLQQTGSQSHLFFTESISIYPLFNRLCGLHHQNRIVKPFRSRVFVSGV
ncbi:hypothetical protein F0562_009179 [Nyssa sinensis]|uniref:Uncharacterized protein n=1 Tax=Nyssa sinensis TaxID=561372 RepID=A0A5J4ZX64_9ASTE|nr:hypothetical protein F0562_009179 [Nyssa sinensis]